MKKILLLIIVTIATSNFVNGQDTTKTLNFSGSVDGYYRNNFSGVANNNTVFTNSQNSFELGMASIKAEATSYKGKVGATVDIGFGKRAEEFSYNDGITKNGFASLSNIKQAFITYAPYKNVKFTAGKFVSHIGNEYLDANLNKNYSMCYMFTNGPYFNTGVKADFTKGNTGFMIGITNFTDFTTSTTSTKSLIAQVSGKSKNEKIKYFLNYTGFGGSVNGANPTGLKSLHQIDVIVNAIINKKTSFGYNATLQQRNGIKSSIVKDGNWIGNAIYISYDINDKLGIHFREELIIDTKNVYYTAKNISASTLSLNYKVGPLTIIPEIRIEAANNNFYTDKNGNGTKSTGSALLAAVYTF